MTVIKNTQIILKTQQYEYRQSTKEFNRHPTKDI